MTITVITINRNHVRTIRKVLRAAFGASARSRGPHVTFSPTTDGVAVHVANGQLAVEHRFAGEATGDPVTVPFAALVACEGRPTTPVTICQDGKQSIVEWDDAGVPQRATYAEEEPAAVPELASELTANDSHLLAALRDAVDTTDRESTRYSLGCIRLRGRDGQLAATDGRQALISTGYSFPWQEELLVPGSRVFGVSELAGAASVETGRTDDWIIVRAGPWTVWLKIEKEGRFPDVDAHLVSTGPAATKLHLSDADADFLRRAVTRLPGGKEFNLPVTVDLNGEVAVRASSADQPTTELVLTGSDRDGPEIRFSTNRTYLSRAVRLGFRSVDLNGAEAPACCRDDRRMYIWALLGKTGCIAPDEQAVRIESAPSTADQKDPTFKRRNASSMKTKNPANNERHELNGNGEQQTVADLIRQGEELKTALRESLTKTSSLLTGLKRHRQQSKRIRSAVQSLRHLQAIDA